MNQVEKRVVISPEEAKGNLPQYNYEPNLLYTLLQRSEKARRQNYSSHTLQNFKQPDSKHSTLLRHLSWISHYKGILVKTLGQQKISTDMKIYYLDSHSMKLGPYHFHMLEEARQNFLYTASAWYVYALATSFVSFFVLARRTSVKRTLYKEIMMSGFLGGLAALSAIGVSKFRYNLVVNQVYEVFTKRMELMYGKSGVLANEDELIMKNFSNTRFNAGDDLAQEDPEIKPMGIFDGGAEADGKQARKELFDRIYG